MSKTKLQFLTERLEALLSQYRFHAEPLKSATIRKEIAQKAARIARAAENES